MRVRLRAEGWWLVATVLAAVVCVYAEDITLTTYYPSPRGVYQQLQTIHDSSVNASAPAASQNPQVRIQETQAGDAARVQFDNNGTDFWQLAAATSDLDPTRSQLSVYYKDAPGVGATLVSVLGTGQVGIGTTAPASSAKLEIAAANQGFRLPQTTPAAIGSPVRGLMIYNTAANQVEFYDGSQWSAIGGGQFGGMWERQACNCHVCGESFGGWIETCGWCCGMGCTHRNPFTNSCTCPPGYREFRTSQALQCYGSGMCDTQLVLCYKR